jgi:branched-chain amino acid transport system ATP-binding protein
VGGVGGERRSPPPTSIELALLEGTAITRYFGGLPAVDGLDFTVEEGEILGVIGPNGAGKTTLMNLISGLLQPTGGQIRFEGRIISGRPPHAIAAAGIARTFQIVKPVRGLTVRENVALGAMFGGERAGRGTRGALERADEVLSFAGLTPRAAVSVGTLTLGELKRLELARALAMEPKLLLLDEVMAGLNPKEVEGAMRLIQDVNGRGITVLMIEHVMKAIMGISHRVLVLHHGRRIALGSPAAVSQDSRVIEAYLGSRYGARREARG